MAETNEHCKATIFQLKNIKKKKKKNPPANAGDAGDVASVPESEDSLEEEMATHTSILAWGLPRAGQPGRLQSMGLQSAGQD